MPATQLTAQDQFTNYHSGETTATLNLLLGERERTLKLERGNRRLRKEKKQVLKDNDDLKAKLKNAQAATSAARDVGSMAWGLLAVMVLLWLFNTLSVYTYNRPLIPGTVPTVTQTVFYPEHTEPWPSEPQPKAYAPQPTGIMAPEAKPTSTRSVPVPADPIAPMGNPAQP